MKRLDELFEVSPGSKLDLNKMKALPPDEGGVNFVGRSSENNGVTATVAPIPGLDPYESGCITVALGGSYLLSSFVQLAPFYTAQNVAVLRPKGTLLMGQKVYICLCIRHNHPRYSAFGREANRTLPGLKVPDPADCPDWAKNVDEASIAGHDSSTPAGSVIRLQPSGWKPYRIEKLFDPKKGRRITKAQAKAGSTPFIGAIDKDNGIARFIDQPPDHPANTLTVVYNGSSVGESFYQSAGFCASDDIIVLHPRFKLTPAIGLFLATVIRHEKYRFSYGRKWNNSRMKQIAIKLPVADDGEPDWEFMERYIRSLPYGERIA